MTENQKNTNPFKSSDILEKLSRHVSKLGQKFVYIVMLLYYAYKRKDTPRWAKNIIIGAISYFLAPFDGVPDLTPFLGFTDDLGLLSFGLVTISCYIDDEVKVNAKKGLSRFFKEVNLDTIAEVDQMY